jgi:hypothetical protein
MKNVLRVLAPVILTLVFATPAAPQVNYDEQLQYLFVPPDWDQLGAGGSSAKVYYCSAKGSWGGSCADCVTTSDGRSTCANVYISAHCKCDAPCKADNSTCNYQP